MLYGEVDGWPGIGEEELDSVVGQKTEAPYLHHGFLQCVTHVANRVQERFVARKNRQHRHVLDVG